MLQHSCVWITVEQLAEIGEVANSLDLVVSELSRTSEPRKEHAVFLAWLMMLRHRLNAATAGAKKQTENVTRAVLSSS